MQTSTTSRKVWLWLVVLLLLFMVMTYFTVSKEPEEYPDYVSESPSPTGVKAMYTYLDSENIPVNRWSDSPSLLTKQGEDQVLILIEPYFIPDRQDMEAYETFMEAGNTILLLATNPDGIFGLKTSPVTAELDEEEAVYNQAGREFQAEKNSPVRIQINDGDEELLYDEVETMALKRPIGNGELIVANAPEWITNDRLLSKDHLPLISMLLPEDLQDGYTVLFDEYSHVTGNASTMNELYPKWLLTFALQGILFIIILLVHQGKRFGPIRVAREETVRFSDERISALSAWYQKGKRYHDSLNLQADYVKLLLQERWGIPYRKAWVDTAEQLERKWKTTSQADIETFLNGLYRVLSNERVSKQEYLVWSKRIDVLRKEVEEG